MSGSSGTVGRYQAGHGRGRAGGRPEVRRWLLGLARVCIAGLGLAFAASPGATGGKDDPQAESRTGMDARGRHQAPLTWLIQSPAPAGMPAFRDAITARLAHLPGAELAKYRFVTAGLHHWRALRAGDGAQAVLEQPHFAAYRATRFDYRPLLSLGPGVSYRVVTLAGSPLVEMEELRGAAVAAVPAPDVGTLRLLDLFPPGAVGPEVVAVDSEPAALDLLRRGAVRAALVSQAGPWPGVETSLVLDEVPGMILSVAGNMDPRLAAALKKQLLVPTEGTVGARSGWRFREIEPERYVELEALLRRSWGYRPMPAATGN